jgi:uncharacterized protein YkwD
MASCLYRWIILISHLAFAVGHLHILVYPISQFTAANQSQSQVCDPTKKMAMFKALLIIVVAAVTFLESVEEASAQKGKPGHGHVMVIVDFGVFETTCFNFRLFLCIFFKSTAYQTTALKMYNSYRAKHGAPALKMDNKVSAQYQNIMTIMSIILGAT